VIVEPCCDSGGAKPESSPVRVTLLRPDSLAEIAHDLWNQTFNFQRRGFAVTQIDAIGGNDDGLVIDIHFETLDPCPYMADALAKKKSWEGWDPAVHFGREPTAAEIAKAERTE
jgi:hypothetical protein